MSDVVTLHVEPRDPQKNKGTGTRVTRRLRKSGKVPAIIYGHKQTPQPIALSALDVESLIQKSVHLANLKFGDTVEQVLVRDVQWDHLGRSIIHLDFMRVSADEDVETEIKLDYHGQPAGLSAGGTLEILVHSVSIRCRASAIPDTIRVELADLGLNQGIHVNNLVLPAGVVVDADPELLLAHVITRAAEPEPEDEATSAEPEVIGRKPEDKDNKEED